MGINSYDTPEDIDDKQQSGIERNDYGPSTRVNELTENFHQSISVETQNTERPATSEDMQSLLGILNPTTANYKIVELLIKRGGIVKQQEISEALPDYASSSIGNITSFNNSTNVRGAGFALEKIVEKPRRDSGNSVWQLFCKTAKSEKNQPGNNGKKNGRNGISMLSEEQKKLQIARADQQRRDFRNAQEARLSERREIAIIARENREEIVAAFLRRKGGQESSSPEIGVKRSPAPKIHQNKEKSARLTIADFSTMTFSSSKEFNRTIGWLVRTLKKSSNSTMMLASISAKDCSELRKALIEMVKSGKFPKKTLTSKVQKLIEFMEQAEQEAIQFFQGDTERILLYDFTLRIEKGLNY